jgi:hypothetical protein
VEAVNDDTMVVPRETYVRAADGVLTQRITGELVLLDLHRGLYYGLDAVGARMFELSCELPDADSVVARLAAEFEAEPPVLHGDLEALLGEMAERGLLVREGTKPGGPEPVE